MKINQYSCACRRGEAARVAILYRDDTVMQIAGLQGSQDPGEGGGGGTP